MKIAIFDTKRYDQRFLTEAAGAGDELQFFESRLTEATVELASGFVGVCVFVHDELTRPVLERLSAGGTRLVALRCAGFNNVDLKAAEEFGLMVVRVPAYSPFSVAEHTVGMMLVLNRRLHRSHYRVREGNFSLDGLLGFDMHGKTVGIVGTGKIGCIVAKILQGFGCELLAYDVRENPECMAHGARYVEFNDLLSSSDIITLHCPLVPTTRHLIDRSAIRLLKPGVMLINTSRGELVETTSVIEGLKNGQIGYLGLDVYEEEEEIFFRDLSAEVLQDDVFARLLTFPNVLVTAHQAFFTREALTEIARTTFESVHAWENGEPIVHRVSVN